MVFDDTLMELMENIGCDAKKDVHVGELSPEGQED